METADTPLTDKELEYYILWYWENKQEIINNINSLFKINLKKLILYLEPVGFLGIMEDGRKVAISFDVIIKARAERRERRQENKRKKRDKKGRRK